MRYRERGVGNMAFIVVLVLLLIAASMAFMKNDDAQKQAKLAADRAKDKDAAIDKQVRYMALTEAVIKGVGLEQQISLKENNIPTPASATEAITTMLKAAAAQMQTDATIGYNATSFKVPAGGGPVGVSSDGKTLTWYKATQADANMTVRGLLAGIPPSMKTISSMWKVAIETNETTRKDLEARIKAEQKGKADQGEAFTVEVTSKQGIIDQLTNEHKDANDAKTELVQQLEDARSEYENLKTEQKNLVRQKDRVIAAQDNRFKNLKQKRKLAIAEDAPDGTIISVGRSRNTIWLDRGRRHKLARGTKFKVWRTGKGGYRQDIAVISVIAVDDNTSEARIIKQLGGTSVTRGMNFSSPFFEANKRLRAYIWGDLREFDSDTARRRLERAGVTVVRKIDNRVDVIIIGEPRVTASDDDGEEGSGTADLERTARLESIETTAQTIGAIAVTERVLKTFIDY